MKSSAILKQYRKHLALMILLVAYCLAPGGSGVVLALSQSDRDAIYNDSVWYKIGGTTTCAPTSGSPSSGSGGPYYLIGDSIGTQIVDTLTSSINGIEVNADSDRTLRQGIEVAEGSSADIKKSKAIILQLGTNAGGFTAANVNEMINKIKSINDQINIYWVDTAVVQRVQYAVTLSGVNEIIYSQSTSAGYKVISWNKKVFGDGADPTNIDPDASDNGFIRRADEYVHLSSSGVTAMTELISSSLSGTSTGAGSGTDCACSTGGTTVDGKDNRAKVWNYLINKGLSEFQTAGIMGNIQSESAGTWDPRVVEYAWSDPPHRSNTVPPDIGPQGQPGYGLIQWTSPGRKQGLRDLSAQRRVIAGDLVLQLDYLWQELEGPYRTVLADIRASTTLADATYIFLRDFESPADVEGNKPVRLRYATDILGEFSGTAGSVTGGSSCGSAEVPADSKIDIDSLGLNSDKIACATGTKDLGVVTTQYTGAFKKESGPLIIRLCQVPDVGGQGNNTNGVEVGGGVVVNSRVSGAWAALGKAAKSAGIEFFGTSSFRLADSCGGSGDGGACATPGGSPHQMGVAIDFYNQMYAIDPTKQSCSVRITRTDSPQWRWMYKNADKFGFEQYSAEAWHWDPLPMTNRCSSSEPPGLIP